MGMTEADMDKADKKELAAKVENAKSILYQVKKLQSYFNDSLT